MTDKEQIMNDNVSNFCLVCYYDNKNKELVRIEQYKDNSGDIQTDIESHKYGYNAKIIKPEELIKQLARKTQECEKIKEKYEALKLENQEGYEIVAGLKQECEELKQRLQCNCFDPKSNNNRCISYNRIAEDYERDLKRLENKIAECEELKEKYKNVLDLAKQNADANEYCLQELEQENIRYRKALEEIEKYINNQGIDNKWNMRIQKFRSGILYIINKAKGEGNE